MTNKKSFQERSHTLVSPVQKRVHPIQIASGKGSYLYDVSGTPYLDFTAGVAVASTGHCHPQVVEAIQTQSETLIHPCIGVGYYEPPIQLAERLNALLAPESYSVFFCQSGSESIEAALKLARYTQKKSKVIAFKGGFHGRTYGALSLTHKPAFRAGYEPLLDHIDFFEFPYLYHRPWGAETVEEALEAGLSALEASPLFNEELAAVIIEPVLGEGGYVPAPPAFMSRLSRRCKELGALLICDEIQSGIARTGEWFACDHFQIKPDIMTLAKGLGSGLPIGACLAKTEIMTRWTPGAHGGTFGGNPVACAAALATLSVLEPELPAIKQKGEFALNYLREQLSDHPKVGDIRGLGLMIGIEFVTDKESACPDVALTEQVIQQCFENRLLLLSCGAGNVIRLCPPLTLSETELTEGLSCLVMSINAH